MVWPTDSAGPEVGEMHGLQWHSGSPFSARWTVATGPPPTQGPGRTHAGLCCACNYRVPGARKRTAVARTRPGGTFGACIFRSPKIGEV